MKKTILLFAMIFSLTQVWADNFESPVDTLCSVTINVVQGGFCLQAEASGTAPFSYEWSNGDTNQTICVNNPNGGGTFCVTMTDASGCVATACGTLDPNGNTCDVWIEQDSAMGMPGIELTAQPTGEAPYIYTWSTGELSPSINVLEDGTYCVTITDNSGCEAISCVTIGSNNPNCSVNIEPTPMGLLIATTTGSAPYIYIWSNGETTESIIPTYDGTYCVDITDNTGCMASHCYYYNGGNDTTCYVTVLQVQGGLCLQATGYGEAPFTYVWENGDTGDTFCSNDPNGGTYCVTMVDANGCASTACGTLGNGGGQDSCWVAIVETNSGDLLASTNPANGTPVSYLWSTGASTETITPTIEGTYCVTITNANGCTAEDCIDFYFFNNIIYGVVLGDTMNNGASGTAYLIQYDANEETLTAVDELNFYQGFFQFNNVPQGEYLVKVALGPNSMGYEENMPTYFDHVLWWDEATTVVVDTNTVYTLQMDMVQGNNPGGPGFIGGLVSEGANFTGGADHREDGDPMENVTMLLLDENDNPVAHTVTNAEGEYAFDNLAWGTYKVYIEITGIEHVMYLVTIGPENPTVDDLDFIVDEDSATTVSIKDLLEESSIHLFPNPTKNQLNLQLVAKEQSEVIFSLMSIDGQTIFTESVELYPGIYTHSFDVNKLPSGLYFINIIDGKETISRKVIKE